jgi:hypothetical protein
VKRLVALAGAAVAAEKIWKRSNAFDLSGRVAVVTGGSRGLGFDLCGEVLEWVERVAM